MGQSKPRSYEWDAVVTPSVIEPETFGTDDEHAPTQVWTPTAWAMHGEEVFLAGGPVGALGGAFVGAGVAWLSGEAYDAVVPQEGGSRPMAPGAQEIYRHPAPEGG